MQTNSNPLVAAHQAGQSLWLDFIQRSHIASGALDKLINEDHICGMTSNPAIFEAAIANTSEYDEEIAAILSATPGANAQEIFKKIAVTDIAAAADRFDATYRASRGDDGMVSLEVSPTLAQDVDGTVAEALELHAALDRQNIMIKVPGTEAGVSAFEQLTAKGVSVNVTLLFSVERYQQIVQAYIRGLEQRLQKSQPIDRIASVASFFVSRVDSATDSALEQIADTDISDALAGKVAIANAKVAYGYFQNIFESPQFAKLRAAGALPQRLLWASTGTKNPEYSDVYYVEELIGPETVNTLPPKTMDAFRDHGSVECKLLNNIPESQVILDKLSQTSVDLAAITNKLEHDGVASFADAFERLLSAIDAKKAALS